MEWTRNRKRIVRLFVCLFARVRPRIKPRIKPCYTSKPSTKLLRVVIHCHLQQQSPKDHKNRSKSFWSTSSCLLLGCKSKTFMENAFDSFMARVEKLWLGSVTDPSRKEKWLAAPALPLSLSLPSSPLSESYSHALSLTLVLPLSLSFVLWSKGILIKLTKTGHISKRPLAISGIKNEGTHEIRIRRHFAWIALQWEF